MYKKASLTCLLALLLSACSTYTTNTELRFESTQIYSRPALPIGDIDQTPDQLTYLGWVDAVVRSPGPFHAPPNQEQVNLVLSHMGEQLGADAIIHINYRERSAPLGLANSYEARGQAVRIISEEEPEHQPVSLSGFDHRIRPAENDSAVRKKPRDASQAAARPAPKPGPDDQPAFTFFDPDNYRALIPRDEANEQLDRIETMLKDARLIQQQAYEKEQNSIYNAATRLIQMLEIQRRQYQQP